ncbi:MAG: oleate hydratase [Methanoregula sp.]|nr:oleate hydratase [Methanoregula sp.]
MSDNADIPKGSTATLSQTGQTKIHAYLIGGGIASLASAAYLIRDGQMPGNNIHIFEEMDINGGSLDGKGSPEEGYLMRGGRMMEEHYGCTFDLFGFIPSLTDPQKTVKDEIFEFNKDHKTRALARLIANGKKVDMTSLGFSVNDRLDLVKLMALSEDSLGTQRIVDYFSPDFFKTNFWHFYCTTFAFESWHSLVELKRYMVRFVHLFPNDGLKALTGVWRTPYNQYDSMVLPLTKWLKEKGVRFELNTQVTDLGFIHTVAGKTVEKIHLTRDGKSQVIPVGNKDLVFVTNGSMTAGSRIGSMDAAPALGAKKDGGSWMLWEKIARNNPEFGRPSVFDDHIDDSKWESFTVTFYDPTFFALMEKFTGNAAGTGGLVTITDSNWLMSVVLAHQPHFLNQPENVQVCWGYGLFPDAKGNFVDKKMSECTGREILIELLYHLHFTEDKDKILSTSKCIPCMMPFITSQFLPRARGDRPLVIPRGCANIAFIGQYCEIPDDVVFTVEYSVRSAQTAVFSLLHLDKEVTPIYKGQYDLGVLYDATRTLQS